MRVGLFMRVHERKIYGEHLGFYLGSNCVVSDKVRWGILFSSNVAGEGGLTLSMTETYSSCVMLPPSGHNRMVQQMLRGLFTVLLIKQQNGVIHGAV